MPRPIFTLLAELQSTLAELVEALNPLQKLAGLFKGGDGPFPMKPAVRRRGPGKKKAVSAAPAEAPAAAAPKKAARPKPKKAKTTNSKLAFQGKYMAAVRGLSVADKAEVKRIRAEQGVEAAIKVALGKG